jgi:hypothetical protein
VAWLSMAFDAGGARVLGTGEGTVADLEFNDVLPLGLEAFGHGEDIKGGFGVETSSKGA